MKILEQLKQKLEDIDVPVYLAGHVMPDNDSIGSCLSLGRLLEKLGKEAHVLLEDFDKNILEVHNNRHLVCNDVTHEDYSFIALDLNEEYRLGRFEEYFKKAKNTINIDHHQGNDTSAELILSRPDKSSTCEIVYDIIKSFGKEFFDNDIYTSLYAGIMTDTGCFARRLSDNTLNIAQELINNGVDYESIIRTTYSHRSLYELKALSLLVDNLKYEGFHYVVMDRSLVCFKDLTHNQIMKTIAEEMRKIDGMDIFLLFIKEGDSLTTKCMSNISKNANIIASLFGGGGHKGEAGFTTDKYTVEEVVATVKDFVANMEDEMVSE